MRHLTSPFWILFGLLAAVELRAQTATASSPPLGGSAISLIAASDSLVSVPFQRPAVFAGQVASVNGLQVVLAGSPNWTASQWVYAAGSQSNTFYVQFTSGTKAGHSFTVAGNDASSLNLDPLNDDLTGVAAGDGLQLIPYWTVAALFPASAAGTAFTVTTTLGAWGTELVLTDPQFPSLNFGSVNTYYFYNGAWRTTSNSPTVDHSDDIVRCDLAFRVRNPGAALTWTFAGAVYTGAQAMPLPTSSGGSVDNPVALLWPLQTTLNSLSLTAGAAFLDSSGVGTRTDILMVYNNGAAQLNKPAASYYIHSNGAWRKLGQPITQDFGTDPIGGIYYSFIVRKAATLTGAPTMWVAPTH